MRSGSLLIIVIHTTSQKGV